MTDSPSNQNSNSAESAPAASDQFPAEFTLDGRQLTSLISDHAVWLLDTERRVVSWNDAAARLMEYDEETALGTAYQSFFPADARKRGKPEQLLERARTDGKAVDDGWRLTGEGNRRWVHEVLATVRDGDVGVAEQPDSTGTAGDKQSTLSGYVVFVNERTQLHERERERSEERAFMKSVFEAQPDIIYAFDARRNLVDWNDRVPEVTGYSTEELDQMGPLEFIAPEHQERIADAISRILEETEAVTIEADLRTKDGARIPYEFNNAQISDADGNILGFTGVGRDVSDRKARERELRQEKALTESIFEAQPDLLYAYDVAGNLIQWNERFEELTGYEGEELEGMHPLQFIAPPDRDHIGNAIDRIMEAGERVSAEGRVATKQGEYIPYEFNSARITDDRGTVLGFTGIGRNISDRKARERELERLERLNATIRAVDETMVSAETRDEIETAIVEAFEATDAYRFAVICRVDTTGPVDHHSWSPQAWAGLTEDSIDDVLSPFVDPLVEDGDDTPFETGTVSCYQHLREDDDGEWREPARTHDYGSLAAVPIIASGRSYGLLVVSATESEAFAEREREVLQEFGGTIGHAINAMTIRRLLYLDTVVELEFESTDRQDICIDLSARANCHLSLEHVLPLTDRMFVYYVTISDVEPDEMKSIADEHASISEFRLVDTADGNSHWELVVSGPTITGLLADYGARMRSKVVDEGDSSSVVQVSRDVNIRELVDTITTTYPDTQLVSKRTAERPVETHGDFRNHVERELTTKQQAALEAAYYGGYFEWPTRHSDASEIAEKLGIARQTFHQHLRVAQEKLLSAYFDPNTAAEDEQFA
ncbi:PAS domain S-box protein [Natronorubrum daqingense]|uniref:histidine kinase n=1 Tax=Natronorubrum daqingense TaxID=588898 RepID=A0A1N6YYC1_9EURY|nr:PAS domain S-box protein [Natronorubrum daqingense]APX95526.1 histidine kinase [Natronorubrum daqingense]SIR19499.1 PAS domain S-box-containing protein [Natronorubrum daqingense]